MTRASDARFMALALSLGRRGLGQAWPNPAVGCVIVRDGWIVGRGWTQPGGRPHAERVALDQAGEAARGSDVFVTLEPCAHHGMTPPCANALVAAGVARVVVALGDPDPRVSGRGLKILREAGITVETGLMEDAARADQAGFLSRVERGRPLVTLKLATSVDGRIATGSGESQWITGPEARRVVHGMRARHDAVMVGGGTARADDPSLTVRGLGVMQQPVRVVVSRRADIPADGGLARTAREVPVWVCHDADAALPGVLADAGVDGLPCAVRGRNVEIGSVLSALAERGITRVFCEGGGSLAASLLQADVVDEMVAMTAGLALGAEGIPALGALEISKLAEAQRFELAELRPVGGDVMARWVACR
ncbi:bifunctional diaminohydroxyphosphoribosylaminopyrimidine deaminase/5-amino-6-(5-phosphoribosylamino)uracil reductase RibD [Aestuariibius sp. 2305UL40-4]|uniref:bifunctional diaminohydroxyphosphoribosylaminopyrimidine deaminase/5-amino-6-(5-phosphoribosylamino)uracil reductase RibD n=1 Tax=Aestuariibius violaceus TaxID=3234132 RepID=UPI00345E59FB